METKLTTQQAAEYLGLTPGRIRQLASAGALRFTTTPHGYRLFTRAALDTYRRNRNPVGRPKKS